MNSTLISQPGISRPRVRGLGRGASGQFRGLRIVLQECDRRAAIVRSLTSLRWIAQQGAEVVFFDGNRTRASVDGSLEAVAKQFPFVTAVEARAHPKLMEAAAAPLAVHSLVPQWIVALSADLAVDRYQVQALLDELREAPEGSLLIPAVLGPDGRHSASRSADSREGAWLARRSDLDHAPLENLTVRPARAASVLGLRTQPGLTSRQSPVSQGYDPR